MLRALQQGTLIGVVVAAVACGGDQTGQPNGAGAGGSGQLGGSGGAASGAAGVGGTGGSAGSQGGSSGAGGSAGVSAGAAGASGAGPSGGTAGAGGAGGTAGAGAGAGTGGEAGDSEAGAPSEGGCAGNFGDERVLLTAGEDFVFSSPTLPGDELELFFVQRPPSIGGRQVFRAERADKDAGFGAPVVVSELDQVCGEDEEWSLSITPDGLRMYVGCYTGPSGVGTPGPLSLARRSDRNAPFVLDAMTYGTVGNGVSVTAAELTALSSAEFDSAGRAPPVEYVRSSLDEAFGASRTIRGLDEVFITAPHLAPDGTTLFGALRPDLVMTIRSAPDAPFGDPIVLFTGDTSTHLYGSPEISADCRTLYSLRADIADDPPVISIISASR